ncbi:GAF domain-containing protein [Rhodoflexus sp.]
MQQILKLIALTDHKIQSRQTLSIAVVVINLIMMLMLVADFIYDLQPIDLHLTSISFIISLLITYLHFQTNISSKIISNGLVMLIYCTAEEHLLTNLKMSTTIVYWLPFVPLVAIVTLGLRYARWWILVVVITHFLNVYYIHSLYGSGYELPIRTSSYAVSGLIFMIVFLSGIFMLYKMLGDAYASSERKTKELEALKNEIADGKRQLEYYQSQLIMLTRFPSLFEWDTETFYANLCKTIQETLQVSRVSIWELDNNHQMLKRRFVACREDTTCESAVLLREETAPYFEALLTSPYIAAVDAHTHPATACFKDVYLVPLDIYSMLDCPILTEGKPMGVICCEHQGSYRQWGTEDILFIQSIADLIAIYQKTKQIRHLLQEISHQNIALIKKTNEAETMNEELNALNEELQTINETLEQRVEERTRQLEIQNQQLREYAFINSHVLRAPLARIRGLLYLMTHDPNASNDRELIEILIREANELDMITTKISDILHDGSNLTREDILRLLAAKETTGTTNEIEAK